MKTCITYEFEIGEIVLIDEIERRGTVDAMSTSINGEEYRVIFWNNGVRHSEWLRCWEISRVKK